MNQVLTQNDDAVSPRFEMLLQITDFLAHEADLLDSHSYGEWHALWTDSCRYWVPANRADIDPALYVSLIYDDADRLKDRVIRLQQPSAYTQEPVARVCRVIGNVRLLEQADDYIRVSSRYVLETLRRGQQDIFTAKVEHVLEPGDTAETFRIREKKVALTANDEPLANLLFLP